MSFILDALKKSEAERQRQASPGLIEPAIAPARARPSPLTIGLLVLLGVNSLVLGFMLLRHPAATRPAPAPSTAALGAARSPPQRATGIGTSPVPEPAPSATIAASPSTTAPSSVTPSPVAAAAGADTADSPGETAGFAPEIPVTTPVNPIVAEARARLSATGAAPSNPADAAAAGASPTAAAEGSDLEPLPTLAQMRFEGADALPPLHLDVHVYSPDPAQRFVFINGHRYVEGSTLAAGPRIVRIRPNGVELAYRGHRFLLPRR